MAGPIIDGVWIVQNQEKQLVSGSYRRNRARIERLIEKDPRLDYYLALAQLEARKQHWDRAQKTIEAILELEPTHAEAKLLLAQVLEAKQEIEQANLMYQAVLDLHPHFSRAYREYARYLMTHTDSLEFAQRLLLRCLEIEPKDALAHTILAEVYLLRGRTGQALLHLKLASHYHEGQLFYHQRIAKLLMHLEQYEEAAKQYKLALREDPKNKDIRSEFRQALKATNTRTGHKSTSGILMLWKRWGG